MTKRGYTYSTTLLLLIGAILLFELVRDSFYKGDFIGYIHAGNAVLNGENIYFDFLNTWPPLFSIFSVILAWGDSLNSFFIRFIWLSVSLVLMYYVVSATAKLFLKTPLIFNPRKKGVLIQDAIILVPLVIMLRYIMENLSNIQINMYMLAASVAAFIFFIRGKFILVGLLLGLTISLKVYTVFILLYFLFKREFKPVLWTLFFIIILNSISFLVFGYEQAIAYYYEWITNVAPKSFIAHHKNQSIFGTTLRFFTTLDPYHKMYVYIMELKPQLVKKYTYLLIIIAAIAPAFLFRKKLKNKSSLPAFLEYSVVLTAIPLLSPVSWKAYFIFLWVPYFLLFLLLYRTETSLTNKVLRNLKLLFWFSVVLNVGSSELFVGNYFSDVLEAYSAITIGTTILLVMQLYIRTKTNLFNFNSFKIKDYIKS